MLTPAFELEQFDGFILITIKAPYIKTNDVEIYIEDNEFKFYVKPYFLRLYFPCELIEDGREKAEYDISTGVFKVEIPKKTVGEFFPNLDMLTTLLAPKKKTMMKPIEVIGAATKNNFETAPKKLEEDVERPEGHDGEEPDDCSNDNEGEFDDSDLCWEVEQEIYQPPNVMSGYKYGFANKVNGVFSRLQGELYEVIDVIHPEDTSPEDRREHRIAEETAKFDADHYIADLLDDDAIVDLIKYRAPWDIEYERIMNKYKNSLHPETSAFITPKGNPLLFSEECEFSFTEKEKEKLLQLPNKEYLLTKEEEHTVFLCLLDIIFAYAYNHRTTEGENTSESPWTICKISSSLSWLDSFKSLHDVLLSGTRRCLCYPLYRHWLLVQKILTDVRRIFLLGKRWLLRCLLEVRALLQSDENKYVLNDLYITDLCVWIQKIKTKKILSLANKLQCSEISKQQTLFPLNDIETNAWKTEFGLQSGSGSEEDSSDSSDESKGESSESESESSESESESSESESGSSELDSCSLDSDDDNVSDSKEFETWKKDSCSQPLQPKIEVIQSTENDTSYEVEVVRTGIEEMLKVKSHIGDDIEES